MIRVLTSRSNWFPCFTFSNVASMSLLTKSFFVDLRITIPMHLKRKYCNRNVATCQHSVSTNRAVRAKYIYRYVCVYVYFNSPHKECEHKAADVGVHVNCPQMECPHKVADVGTSE